MRVNTSLIWVLIVGISSVGFGQSAESLVDVVPPSPEATAIQRYGNTNVSHYTGAASVTIPLYTIRNNTTSLPIALNYTGSNGITVQEMASRVGLGWSLGAGGAVSRVIRGLADDKQYVGFLNYGEIEDPQFNGAGDFLNIEFFQEIGMGRQDGEPDKYMYNVNGISGTFYIDKDGNPMEVPLSNRRIIPDFGTSVIGSLKLEGFTIIDENGIIYQFDEQEESQSVSLEANLEDNSYDVSTWHLSSIKNHASSDVIQFDYVPYTIETYNRNYSNIIDPTLPFVPHYSKTKTNGLRLNEISWNYGRVAFNPGQNRCDLNGDNVLSSIEIFNANNEMVTKWAFDYSYFYANGTIELGDPCNADNGLKGLPEGNKLARLRLDKVTQLNDLGGQLPPYEFTYEENVFLPSRHSYSVDFWGYYNGKTNSTLVPKYKKDLSSFAAVTSYGQDALQEFGTADRNADENYAIAGVLTKISYPTNGYTTFEFEGNRAVNETLPNEMNTNALVLTSENVDDFFTVNLVKEPFSVCQLQLFGDIDLDEFCDVEIIITNTDTDEEFVLSFYDAVEPPIEGAPETAPLYFQKWYLEEGTYKVYYRIDDNDGNCTPDGPLSVNVSWENEVYVLNKKVGGIRLKNSTDYPLIGESISRNYFYNEDSDQGMSSGSVVVAPKFGFIEYDYSNTMPLTWMSTYNSNLPLVNTKGSPVGYSRVEEVIKGGENGKKVYYFTSAKNYPDLNMGYNTYTNKDTFYPILDYSDELNSTGFGISSYNSAETYPSAQSLSMEWKRGLPLANISYVNNIGTYEKLHEEYFQYKFYGAHYQTPIGWYPPFIPSDQDINSNIYKSESYPVGLSNYIRGIRVGKNGNNAWFPWKYNNIYTGRYELTRTITIDHGSDGTLQTSKDIYYDYADDSGNDDKYVPSSETVTNSKGDQIKTTTKYAFNYADLDIAGLSIGERDDLEEISDVKNIVNLPVLIEQGQKNVNESTFVPITKKQTHYLLENGNLALEKLESAVGTSHLEEDIRVEAYFNDGSPKEIIRRGGVLQCFVKDEMKNVIVNATNSTSDGIAYFSFENSGVNFDNSKSGDKVWNSGAIANLNFTTNRNDLLMTYWYWENEQWNFSEEMPFSNSISTSGTKIDEVRIFPPGAVLTTYTYNEKFQKVNSVTDLNNIAVHYYYDDFGRLVDVKDDKGNLIKHVKYNYQTK